MLLSHVSGSLYTAACAGMIRILQLLCSSSSFIILLLSRTGVPKQHRGEVWKFLSEQNLLRQTVSSQPPPDNTPYKELLKQVSSEQHAILIDLGTSDMHYTHISTPTLTCSAYTQACSTYTPPRHPPHIPLLFSLLYVALSTVLSFNLERL